MFLFRRIQTPPRAFLVLRRSLQMITGVGHVHERPNAVLVVIGGKQNNARFRFGNAQFDPALFIIKRLVGDDGES